MVPNLRWGPAVLKLGLACASYFATINTGPGAQAGMASCNTDTDTVTSRTRYLPYFAMSWVPPKRAALYLGFADNLGGIMWVAARDGEIKQEFAPPASCDARECQMD